MILSGLQRIAIPGARLKIVSRRVTIIETRSGSEPFVNKVQAKRDYDEMFG
jgi:hypothetical protein